MFNLRQAAEHVHLEANELRHVAQRGEIEAEERNGEFYFEHRALDEWAQRNLLSSNKGDLEEVHRSMMTERQRDRKAPWSAAEFFRVGAIDLGMRSKTKGGAIRDMTDLAVKSGLVYDIEGLFKELSDREEAAPTAVGNAIALLHPRYHDPYFFEESFIAYARSDRGVFFGAPDGEVTRHFFLICATDHEVHLHILARLAMLAHGTELMERLDAAEEPDEVIAAIRECEKEFL